MPKIKWIADDEGKFYPPTIPQAVVDPASGESVRTELDEKAKHGYESGQKTLKAVDEAKVDKSSIVGETGQGETSVMHQKAVTDELSTKAEHGYETEPKTLKQVDDEVIQLEINVSELELKGVVQSDKIKDIENVISTMNPSQSAQLSVSGRKIVSLPKNASNGGMEVKLEGLTAENLVVNGDFRNGSTGWNVGDSAQVAVLNNECSILGSAQFAGISQHKLQSIAKFYISVDLKTTSPDIRIYGIGVNGMNISVYSSIGSGMYEKYRGILNVESFTIGDLSIQDIRTSGFDNFYVKNVKVINLTSLFGSGNEPDLATCNAMFSDYFEGVKSFVPTGRVRSVGKNVLDISSLKSSDFVGIGSGFMSTLIPVVPNVTYTVRAYDIANLGNPYFYIDWRNEDMSLPYSFVAPFGLSSHSRVFSTDKMMFTISSVSSEIDRKLEYIKKNIAIQIERSPASTPYEPYKETSLYLTAPELLSNGLVKDEIRKGANGYELVKRISDVDGTVLATPVISPISYGGILNSAENGTVYHEPVIADAGVYDTKIDILLTDYPITAIEEIIKHENGVDTYLDVATAVIAGDGLSFTHPDLTSGDLVLFTYAFDKESANGNITATFYDSNVVKIDTVTGKAYKITDVVTNGVLTRTLTEV